MSGNFAIKGGGGVGPLMANAILNFHFDFPHTSLTLLTRLYLHSWHQALLTLPSLVHFLHCLQEAALNYLEIILDYLDTLTKLFKEIWSWIVGSDEGGTADKEFVKCFTPARFPNIYILPKKNA